MAVIAEVALRGPHPESHFEEVYASCQPRVFRTCLAILRNTDDAAEATQEVFSRALPLLTELREPHVWLQTVARNYCLDQLRRQKVRGIGTELSDDTPGNRHDPERETMLRDALRQAFEALSGRERRALGRVLLMDDSLADIAGMLGVSYGAAAQVVSRARRRAAMAARAVIGASLALLARLGWQRERGRTSRAAAQMIESGQHVILAAAVLFTAGSMAHPSVAFGAPHSSAQPVAPQLVAASAGVHDAAAPAPAPAVSVPSVTVPASILPPGYGPIKVMGSVNGNNGGNGSKNNSGKGSGSPLPGLSVDQTGPTCFTVGTVGGPLPMQEPLCP
jgi:RNA polymerase sigma-70 factor (ECF subfamily)